MRLQACKTAKHKPGVSVTTCPSKSADRISTALTEAASYSVSREKMQPHVSTTQLEAHIHLWIVCLPWQVQLGPFDGASTLSPLRDKGQGREHTGRARLACGGRG